MNYESWGRYPHHPQAGVLVRDEPALQERIHQLHHEGFLPFGHGRSYGDSCLAASGYLLNMQSWDHLLEFDRNTGILEARPGIKLSEISRIAVPAGWMLPVTPGTELISLGGAVANDVHGKNHLAEGSFGHHVLSFELRRSDGEVLVCSRNSNPQWFYHTIGGLGLTGVLTRIRLQLKSVPGPWLSTRSIKMHSLDDYFSLEQEHSAHWEHRVAWVDCLARGGHTGRGWYLLANPVEDQRPVPRKRSLVAPALPFSPLNRMSLKLFNQCIYHFSHRNQVNKRVDYQRFLYPLDHVHGWNRLYGTAGFQQYQCVIPVKHAHDTIRELLTMIAKAGQGSFLVVLKRFGGQEPAGALSFPREGFTLALDFPNRDGLDRLFHSMDACVRAASGALYPAKDAHMSAGFFRQAYPAWEEHEQLRDPVINSWFWKRVTEGV